MSDFIEFDDDLFRLDDITLVREGSTRDGYEWTRIYLRHGPHITVEGHVKDEIKEARSWLIG